MAIHSIEHINISAQTGVPRIRGHRITVSFIVRLIYQQGATVQGVTDAYQLTPGEVYAALSYYHDHQEEVDELLRQGDVAWQQALQENPTLAEHERLNDVQRVMTVKEAAHQFGVAERTIREALEARWGT
jgi:uncharacterized protein (DUF433 family)